jgi:hypothetical protein
MRRGKMRRFNIPEIFLGSALTVAVFGIGMTFQSQRTERAPIVSQPKIEILETSAIGWTWLTKDAAGFFALAQVVVGIGQAVLFVYQLRYMRRGMADAAKAANAARDGALASAEATEISRQAYLSSLRPWVIVREIIPQDSLHWDDAGMGLSFAFVVENIGNSIASNVDVSAVVHLSQMGDLKLRAEKLRSDGQQSRLDLLKVNVGRLIVPGETTRFPCSIFLNNDLIKEEFKSPFDHVVNMQGLNIMIVGCINYGSVALGSQHQSGFLFSVSRKVSTSVENPSGRVGIRPDEKIPKDLIAFDKFGAGFYAN